MSIKRKSRRRRRHHKRPRLYFGGYSDSWKPQPMDKIHKPDFIKKRKEELKKKYGHRWHDWFLWGNAADKWYNSDKLEEGTIKDLTGRYQNGNDEQRARVLEELEDELKARDISANPKEYIQELMNGKHKSHHTLAQIGGYGAQIAAYFLAYKYGWPLVRRMLFGSKKAAPSTSGTGGTPSTGADDIFGNFTKEDPNGFCEPGDKPVKDFFSGAKERVVSGAKKLINTMRELTPAEKLDVQGLSKTFTFDDLPFDLPGNLNHPEMVTSFLKNNGAFTLTPEGNPGFLGVKDSIARVRDEAGKMYKIGVEHLPTWMKLHPTMFTNFSSNWNNNISVMSDGDTLNWLQRAGRWIANKWSGSGYHVTRKGRHLVRRYRRHLRHRRLRRR